MAIRFKLSGYETVIADPLGRGYVGYFPRMTESEAWQAGRGVWKASVEKIGRQRFALVVGEGVVRVVAEITGHTEHDTPTGTRIALTGDPLPEGHPVRDAYLGEPDPITTGSQNPVGYCDLPEEQEFLQRPCACGCRKTSDRDFLPGHDVRAIQQRVRDQFDGSALKLIQFLDTHMAVPCLVPVPDKPVLADVSDGPDGPREATPRVHIPAAPPSPVSPKNATTLVPGS